MSSKLFIKRLNKLEKEVADYVSELLSKQKEFIIFSEEDLEHDTPDYYLEYRNSVTGNVIDVHPLKITEDGILVVEADGSFSKHLLKFSDLANTQDMIYLCEIMENNLDN